jgi:hypothetical protein
MSQAITTKYIGATNYKSSRVKASTESGISITMSWDDGLDVEGNHVKAAQALTKKLNWGGKWAGGGTKTGYVFVNVDRGNSFTQK